MYALVWKNGVSYDADTVIQQFLTTKGKNQIERATLVAEYYFANDSLAWIELIINKYGFTLSGSTIDTITRK